MGFVNSGCHTIQTSRRGSNTVSNDMDWEYPDEQESRRREALSRAYSLILNAGRKASRKEAAASETQDKDTDAAATKASAEEPNAVEG
jgi:hypothetical protein